MIIKNGIVRMYEITLQISQGVEPVTALIGVALSVSGLQMQTVFQNPLADPYLLGVSSGAGLGLSLIHI